MAICCNPLYKCQIVLCCFSEIPTLAVCCLPTRLKGRSGSSLNQEALEGPAPIMIWTSVAGPFTVGLS